jgi:hypothetical protein
MLAVHTTLTGLFKKRQPREVHVWRVLRCPEEELPPLPDITLISIPRRDGPPMPPFTDQPDQVSVREPWPERRTDASWHPDDWLDAGKSWTDPFINLGQSIGQFQHGILWRSWLWEVSDIEGLRWEPSGPPRDRNWQIAFDRVRLGPELPAHQLLGPNGEAVAQVLDDILTLDPGRIMRLPVEPSLPRFLIPGDSVDAGPDQPIERSALGVAAVWLEALGFTLGDEAGGHYYSGCYFAYLLSDPHWLAALGIVRRAVWATVQGPDWHDPRRDQWLADWHELLGR